MGRRGVSAEHLREVCERVGRESGFSGAVRIDLADGSVIEYATGLADRRWAAPFTVDTRTSIASATKGFTALATVALIEAGTLSFDTRARSLLGPDLPLIDDDVTIEQLLGHRSGIGDYLDETVLGDIADYVMPVPVHQLDSTPAYLSVLEGHEQRTSPGKAFAYNNGGFVVLALLVERAAGSPFDGVVDELVCRPAGLTDTGFLRADSLPAGVATGYLDADGLATNVLHLPLLGSGDGGLFSTVADMRKLWLALFDGRIVASSLVARITRPRSTVDNGLRYGLGFWLASEGPMVNLEGYDAGVSFGSWHDPGSSQSYTVAANTSPGAWPLLKALGQHLGPS